VQPLESGDPQRVGRYRLVARLGSGGMGQVYFGRSAAGRAVAVKRIHPHFAADPAFRDRFAREVAAARQVSGAFTAPVIDADAEAEFPWLVTSFVPSLPLDEAVERCGPLPEATVRVLAVGLAEALQEIHRCGIVHRDLKPGNVLLAEDGPRVIDFGIARAAEGGATQSVIGTPGFMSPEQINGRALQPSSDIFAFGAVLAYAASGAGPFGEGPMPAVAMRIMQEQPDLSAVPPGLRDMVAACLTKEEGRRPAPGRLLDALGEAPAQPGSWLPGPVAQAVQETSRRASAALAAAPAEPAGPAGQTAVLGAQGADATGTMRAPDPGATAALPWNEDPGYAGAGTTAALPRPQSPGQAGPGHDAGSTAAFPRQDGLGQGGDAAQDPYAGMYRGQGPPQGGARPDPHEEARRRQEEQRRQAEERARQERERAERDATRQARRQARRVKAPSLWRFAGQLPLLVIPLIQIPLGIAAAYGWQWFTATDAYWGSPWYYEPGLLSLDGFLHALFLGYFLFNNLVGLDWLVRSLRSAFIVGVALALIVLVGTNAALAYFGFF
jgi:eukaryotic-like serine/threonine-protein kinase